MDEEWEGEIIERLMDAISSLPPEEQTEAIHAIINGLVKQMPTYDVREMRDEIAEMFDAGSEPSIARSTLDMIDGQLALRQLSGGKEWR